MWPEGRLLHWGERNNRMRTDNSGQEVLTERRGICKEELKFKNLPCSMPVNHRNYPAIWCKFAMAQQEMPKPAWTGWSHGRC